MTFKVGDEVVCRAWCGDITVHPVGHHFIITQIIGEYYMDEKNYPYKEDELLFSDTHKNKEDIKKLLKVKND